MVRAKSGISVIVVLQLITGAFASFLNSSTGLFNHSVQANITSNASIAIVAAPYFRNVSAGDAWVVPGTFDLGARSMLCECFDSSRMYPSSCLYINRGVANGSFT